MFSLSLWGKELSLCPTGDRKLLKGGNQGKPCQTCFGHVWRVKFKGIKSRSESPFGEELRRALCCERWATGSVKVTR